MNLIKQLDGTSIQGNEVYVNQMAGGGGGEGSERGDDLLYAFVFPRFFSRPFVSSWESGIWSGAAISFPCAATFCMSVSHMTSLIPLVRASCDFNLATSSSSSASRPSGRVSGSAPFSVAG